MRPWTAAWAVLSLQYVIEPQTWIGDIKCQETKLELASLIVQLQHCFFLVIFYTAARALIPTCLGTRVTLRLPSSFCVYTGSYEEQTPDGPEDPTRPTAVGSTLRWNDWWNSAMSCVCFVRCIAPEELSVACCSQERWGQAVHGMENVQVWVGNVFGCCWVISYKSSLFIDKREQWTALELLHPCQIKSPFKPCTASYPDHQLR
jgi:hypothetical protein